MDTIFGITIHRDLLHLNHQSSYMRLHSFLFLLLMLIATNTQAQKILVVSNIHHPYQEIFRIHSKVSYQLEDEKDVWREDIIEEIDVTRGWLIFQNGKVPIDDIAAIRTYPPHPKLKAISGLLTTFGVTAGFWSIVAALLKKPVTYFIGSTAALIGGWIFDHIYLHKTYWLHKKHFLRVIDLDDKTPIRA